MIPRLYDVTDGEVLFDSVNIKHFSIKDLASQISIVPQKSFLFSGTLEENLQFGKEDATKEEMIKALEIAQSLEFVKNKAKETELDDFLKLPVAQGGTNFSGGQRQRLAIARAIVRNPKVYIFDDSFSALDYATDSKLRSSLSEVTKDSTVIIVAQRVSTIRHAEKIIVMDSGKVVGIGTHEELYKDCQTYQEIVNSQLSAQEVLK